MDESIETLATHRLCSFKYIICEVFWPDIWGNGDNIETDVTFDENGDGISRKKRASIVGLGVDNELLAIGEGLMADSIIELKLLSFNII